MYPGFLLIRITLADRVDLILTIRDCAEAAEDCGGALMLPDLQDDAADGGVHDSQERENDKVGNDQEEIVASGDRSIKSGSSRSA